MPITLRPFAGALDLPRVAALIASLPAASRHIVDYPWRLASPALDGGENTRLAEDDAGTLVGCAVWQRYWAALDLWLAPGAAGQTAEMPLFAWAEGRFRALDAERGRALPYWLEAREDDADRLAVLARHGYTLDDDYAYVQMRRPLDEDIPAVAPPPGYRIRPLAGVSEVDAYVAPHRAAFASDSMTAAWRRRTLRCPEYVPALDLVAEAPDGSLAGFCVLWLASTRRAGQVEPLGIAPAHRGRGLARALLAEAFARLRAHGAEVALVETESTRAPARRAYEASGFRVAHSILRKGKYLTRLETQMVGN